MTSTLNKILTIATVLFLSILFGHVTTTFANSDSQNTSSNFTNNNFYYKTTEDVYVYTIKNDKETIIGKLNAGFDFQRISGTNGKHNITFSNQPAYVYSQHTIVSQKQSLRNPTSITAGQRSFTVSKNAKIYDNSTGALIPIGSLERGASFPIISTMGLWYKVNISGTTGYIHSSFTNPSFLSSDKYFEVRQADVPAYDNSTGKLIKTATLLKGQQYKINSISGSWISFQFGSKVLYVFAGDVAPANGLIIKNATTNIAAKGSFKVISSIDVMDNSSGKLVPFASINKGTEISFIQQSGSWYLVNIGNRAGYVHQSNIKLPFKSSDSYMEVITDNVQIYRSENGILSTVGKVLKGQAFKRLGSMGAWQKIQWGSDIMFIPDQHVRPPYSVNLTNLNSGNIVNSEIELYSPNIVNIYDLSKSSPQLMGTIQEKEYLSLVKENREYWTILIGGRVGHVLKEEVIVGPIINHVNYANTLNDVLLTQMTRSPQTDLYKTQASYVHKNYITINPEIPTEGLVNSSSLNVRELPKDDSWIIGKLLKDAKVKIISTNGEWHQIQYGPWKNAKQPDVQSALNPNLIKSESTDFYQFLVLSKNAGMRPTDLDNKILYDKGTLANKGRIFVNASYEYNINEVYLISHALLETGNGKSALASGVLVSQVKGKIVPPKKVYNMFGIRAIDSCPLTCGAEYAYEQGWFTPELAITGGAKFISEQYVNHPIYKQDTLYKMRWNPNMPGNHQYATDIGWAKKQVPNIKKLYDLIDQHTLYFEVPHYK